MTTLRDPFAVTHKKDIKNKAGQVVAQVDYVGWSQVADRLDDVEPEWTFTVIALGDDWCHGRLTIGNRAFENVGYAENADQDWKKEPLKDAVSDAFKRCAALAGVARYLYDKDAPRTSRPPVSPPPAANGGAAGRPPRPVASTVPPEPDWMDDRQPVQNGHSAATAGSDERMTMRELFSAAEAQGIPKSDLGAAAKKLYGGNGFIKDLDDEQRAVVWAEVAR